MLMLGHQQSNGCSLSKVGRNSLCSALLSTLLCSHYALCSTLLIDVLSTMLCSHSPLCSAVHYSKVILYHYALLCSAHRRTLHQALLSHSPLSSALLTEELSTVLCCHTGANRRLCQLLLIAHSPCLYAR